MRVYTCTPTRSRTQMAPHKLNQISMIIVMCVLNSNVDCVILMWLEKATCFSLLSHVVILLAADD